MMTSAAAIIFALKPWKKITIGNKKEARGWLLYNKSRLNIYTNEYMDKSLQLLRAHFAMNLELASDWLPNFVPFKMSIFFKENCFWNPRFCFDCETKMHYHDRFRPKNAHNLSKPIENFHLKNTSQIYSE